MLHVNANHGYDTKDSKTEGSETNDASSFSDTVPAVHVFTLVFECDLFAIVISRGIVNIGESELVGEALERSLVSWWLILWDLPIFRASLWPLKGRDSIHYGRVELQPVGLVMSWGSWAISPFKLVQGLFISVSSGISGSVPERNMCTVSILNVSP
jgi:hypothetical protein